LQPSFNGQTPTAGGHSPALLLQCELEDVWEVRVAIERAALGLWWLFYHYVGDINTH